MIFKERILNYFRINRLIITILFLSTIFSVYIIAYAYGIAYPGIRKEFKGGDYTRITFNKPIKSSEIQKINEILQSFDANTISYTLDMENQNILSSEISKYGNYYVVFNSNKINYLTGKAIEIDNLKDEIIINKATISPNDSKIKIGNSLVLLNKELKIVDIAFGASYISLSAVNSDDFNFNELTFLNSKFLTKKQIQDIKTEMAKYVDVKRIYTSAETKTLSKMDQNVLIQVSFIGIFIISLSYVFIIIYIMSLQNKNDNTMWLFGLSKNKIRAMQMLDVLIFNAASTIIGLISYSVLYKLFIKNLIADGPSVYSFMDYLRIFALMVIFSTISSLIIQLAWNFNRKRKNEKNLS